MKLLTYFYHGREAYGAVKDGGVVEFGGRLGEGMRSLRALLAQDGLARARDILEASAPDCGLDEIVYRRPVPFPEKILCVGINYEESIAMFRGAEREARPTYPNLFFRTPGSLVGHGEALLRPPESGQLDYEGEIGLIIGRGGRRIPRKRAHAHIAGLTCVNEGTIRDWVRHGSRNITQGKNFERSGAIGPWIATLDEFDDLSDVTLRTYVNGEERQSGSTATLFFDFARLIEYVSTVMALTPGDVISTGSPPGAGARLKPPRFLVPGDEVVVEVVGVGRLVNRVADEQL